MKFISKIALFILIICFLNGCNSTNSTPRRLVFNQHSSKEEKIKNLTKPIFCLSVIIPNLPNQKYRAIGTGFLASENLLATAFHVKKDLDSIVSSNTIPNKQIIAWKKLENGEILEIPLNLAAVDQDSDLALFSFNAENIKERLAQQQIYPLKFADRLPDIGEDILSVGYYSQMDFPFNSLGNVSTIDKGEDIYSDVTLMPGNSGSPLVSMKTGEILGVNIKVMTMGDGTIRLGIAKRISKLSELMKKVVP